MTGTRLRRELLTALLSGEGTALERAERVTGKPHVVPARLYIVLGAMERDDLVSCRQREPLQERGNRPRTYYRLTHAGELALTQDMPASLPWWMRLSPFVLLATCVAGGLSAIGVPWAGLISAILFILLSALAAVLLWRLP